MTNAQRRRFEVTPGKSAVLIEARSNVGPIAFGTTGVQGALVVSMEDGAIDLEGAAPEACLSIELLSFSSGNSVYDAELRRRIGAKLHPTTTLALQNVSRIGRTDRYQVEGDLAFHGLTRRISGTVGVEIGDGGELTVVGEHVFDIRDFDVDSPSLLMLRIYPDVRVELQLYATPIPAT
ncbi:MAG TPA: YceI family protein [Acidimicrobiales bacterium]|nr:YceI family protein [Acidimicrobiales bacterium]